MKELINKKIKQVIVSGEYQDYITFVLDNDENISYHAYGDCCSESYFSEIWNIKDMIGKEILEVEELQLMPGDAPIRKSRQEHDSIYGYRLKSKADDYYDTSNNMTVIFRNSSNGYYGGNIELSIIPDTDNRTDEPIKSIDISSLENWSAPSL